MDTRPWEKTEIRKRFKQLRRKALLTQKNLSLLIKVCRQSISKIENGHVSPNPGTWARFYELEQKHYQPPIVFPTRWFDGKHDRQHEMSQKGDINCAFRNS